jgi:predicted DNA binding CopG/RHH family protein
MAKPKGTKTHTKSGIEVEHLGNADEAGFDLSEAELEKAELMTRMADAEDDACRVNFRWTKEQLNLVKLVAERIGVPYQAYIKQVLFERTVEDLKKFGMISSGAAPSRQQLRPENLHRVFQPSPISSMMVSSMPMTSSEFEKLTQDERVNRVFGKADRKSVVYYPTVENIMIAPDPLVHESAQERTTVKRKKDNPDQPSK